MSEKDTVFSSSVKYNGVFSFKDFYAFCYEWLTEETGIGVSEGKYEEKIKGDSKDILVEWSGSKTVSDYFKFSIDVTFSISGLRNVEITQSGKKIQTNQGGIKVSTKGTLIRDYQGKFETSAFNKFLRSIYEKWVITSRIGQFEDKLACSCNSFLEQVKAYLDLEGKK